MRNQTLSLFVTLLAAAPFSAASDVPPPEIPPLGESSDSKDEPPLGADQDPESDPDMTGVQLALDTYYADNHIKTAELVMPTVASAIASHPSPHLLMAHSMLSQYLALSMAYDATGQPYPCAVTFSLLATGVQQACLASLADWDDAEKVEASLATAGALLQVAYEHTNRFPWWEKSDPSLTGTFHASTYEALHAVVMETVSDIEKWNK